MYYDEIVEFSGIENLVKHRKTLFFRYVYASGISIVANFNADIFLFDRYLA